MLLKPLENAVEDALFERLGFLVCFLLLLLLVFETSCRNFDLANRCLFVSKRLTNAVIVNFPPLVDIEKMHRSLVQASFFLGHILQNRGHQPFGDTCFKLGIETARTHASAIHPHRPTAWAAR